MKMFGWGVWARGALKNWWGQWGGRKICSGRLALQTLWHLSYRRNDRPSQHYSPAHVIRPLLWVVLSRSLHVKALEFGAFGFVFEKRRLHLINPRVLKRTITHAVCRWRCWTLPFLRLERERISRRRPFLVYEIILLNKILRNHLLSENVKIMAKYETERLISVHSETTHFSKKKWFVSPSNFVWK